MNNEIVNAMEELENWLADPSELGRKPAKIEYTASFEDEDGIKCMIFKFKKSFFGKWLLGIVSESGTFSEMKEYNSATETENAILDGIFALIRPVMTLTDGLCVARTR